MECCRVHDTSERRQSVRSLAFLQAEWIPMLTDCTSVSIALGATPQWPCIGSILFRVRTCRMPKEAEPSLSDKTGNWRTAGRDSDSNTNGTEQNASIQRCGGVSSSGCVGRCRWSARSCCRSASGWWWWSETTSRSTTCWPARVCWRSLSAPSWSSPRCSVSSPPPPASSGRCASYVLPCTHRASLLRSQESQHTNSTELSCISRPANTTVNSPIGVHVFRTNRPISLQCL